MNTPKKKPVRITDATRRDVWREHRTGATYRVIAERLALSLGTVAKILKAAEPVPASPLAEPSVDAALVDTPADAEADLAELDRLSRKASREGNLAGVATMERLKVAVREHLRKSAPPADAPEGIFVARAEIDEAAARVRGRWHALADRLAEVSTSPLADNIGRLLRSEEDAT